jgi:hypothetical protein
MSEAILARAEREKLQDAARAADGACGLVARQGLQGSPRVSQGGCEPTGNTGPRHTANPEWLAYLDTRDRELRARLQKSTGRCCR